MANDREDSATKNHSQFNSNMAEVGNNLSKEWWLPAALRPLRTSRLLSTSQQQLFSEAKNSQSANRLLVTAQDSAAQDFQLETPDEVVGKLVGLNNWWESLTKIWKIPPKNVLDFWLCRSPTMKHEKWSMMNGWRESTARVGRSDVMGKMNKLRWWQIAH